MEFNNKNINITMSLERNTQLFSKNGKEEIINIDCNENIYSYEIDSISQSIINNHIEVNYPGLRIDDIILNMKIIDNWINS